MLTIDDVIERFDGSLAYSNNSKEICQYIADLLKELKERRKAPEIIRCKECKFNKTPLCAMSFQECEWNEDNDYCSCAERRTDANG